MRIRKASFGLLGFLVFILREEIDKVVIFGSFHLGKDHEKHLQGLSYDNAARSD